MQYLGVAMTPNLDDRNDSWDHEYREALRAQCDIVARLGARAGMMEPVGRKLTAVQKPDAQHEAARGPRETTAPDNTVSWQYTPNGLNKAPSSFQQRVDNQQTVPVTESPKEGSDKDTVNRREFQNSLKEAARYRPTEKGREQIIPDTTDVPIRITHRDDTSSDPETCGHGETRSRDNDSAATQDRPNGASEQQSCGIERWLFQHATLAHEKNKKYTDELARVERRYQRCATTPARDATAMHEVYALAIPFDVTNEMRARVPTHTAGQHAIEGGIAPRGRGEEGTLSVGESDADAREEEINGGDPTTPDMSNHGSEHDSEDDDLPSLIEISSDDGDMPPLLIRGEGTSSVSSITTGSTVTGEGRAGSEETDDTPLPRETRGCEPYVFFREPNGNLRCIALQNTARLDAHGERGEDDTQGSSSDEVLETPQALILQRYADDEIRELGQSESQAHTAGPPIEYLPGTDQDVLHSYSRPGHRAQIMRRLSLEILNVTDESREDEFLLSVDDAHTHIVLWYPMTSSDAGEIYLALRRHLRDFGAPRMVDYDPHSLLTTDVMEVVRVLLETGDNVSIILCTRP